MRLFSSFKLKPVIPIDFSNDSMLITLFIEKREKGEICMHLFAAKSRLNFLYDNIILLKKNID
jgi:hypothetical protein